MTQTYIMVLIDDMEAPFGRMIMCHMVADTNMELVQMALAIGMKASWIQHKGTYKEHFDVSKTRKAKAIELGAKQVTMSELSTFIQARRPK